MLMFTRHQLFDHFRFTLIHGPNIPSFYAMLFFTAADFTFTTRLIHTWTLFPLWLSLFIPSGVISPLFSSSILDTYQPGEFNFQCSIFFVLSYYSWGLQGKNTEVVCHPFSSGPHFARTLPMTCLSWLALHGMAHSFIELDKAVIHVISLVSFLLLWFSFCLPSDE